MGHEVIDQSLRNQGMSMKNTTASWIKIGPICVAFCALAGLGYGFLTAQPVSLPMLALSAMTLVSIPCLFHLLCAFVLLRPVKMEFVAFTMLLLIGIMCVSLHLIRFVCPDYSDLDKGVIFLGYR
jgi:hypothetical protein